MGNNWAHVGTSILASFLACLVECVETLTVVLAVGSVRGWRSALTGTATAIAVLLLIVATVLLRTNGESPRDVFLGRRPPLREMLIGVALIGPLLLGVGVVLLAARQAWPLLHNVADNPLTGLLKTSMAIRWTPLPFSLHLALAVSTVCTCM